MVEAWSDTRFGSNISIIFFQRCVLRPLIVFFFFFILEISDISGEIGGINYVSRNSQGIYFMACVK